MKLSEIFRRLVYGEEPSPEPKADAPQRENSADLLPFADPIEELSGEESAISGDEVAPLPFEPPRAPLPEGYYYPDAKEAAHIHTELLRELIPEHSLFGVPLQLFAAYEDNQDALFQYRGNPRRFVLVHLTWIGKAEINEHHPSILFDGTFAEFLEREKELYGLEPPT